MTEYNDAILDRIQRITQLLNQSYAENKSFNFCNWLLRALLSYHKAADNYVNLSEFQALKADDCQQLSGLKASYRDTKALEKLACLKLSGGLGTTMGLQSAKCLLPVTEGKRFIDIIIDSHQRWIDKSQANIPLLLMSSFYTHDDLSKEAFPDFVKLFKQHKSPRLLEGRLEQSKFEEDKQNWAPPGHGDVYTSLLDSGILQQLLDDGKELLFVSNSDNLSADIEPAIAEFILDKGLDFVMEVTKKEQIDVKGGTLGRNEGSIHLIERAQIKEAELQVFEDIQQFQLFNTNNLWINLNALKTALQNRQLDLPLIVNKKQINGQNLVQLETAMGAAIDCFENSACVLVERDRFFPVKNNDDLERLKASLN